MNKQIRNEIIKTLSYGIDESVKKAYGRSLKELREHTNTTQQYLAEKTHVPRQSISVYERGETMPTVLQAFKIAFFFNLSIDDFIIYGMDTPLFSDDIKEFKSITDKYDSMNKQ